MDLLPILADSGKYPEMEIGLFQTESSYNYAAEWLICEIPTLKPMFDYANMLGIIENIWITFIGIIHHKLLLHSTYTGNTYDIEVHALAPIVHGNMGVAFGISQESSIEPEI